MKTMNFSVLLQLLRMPDWLKSCFVLLGVFYSKAWPTHGAQAVLAAFSFAFISSSVYVFNDLRDESIDKKHPIKKFRPIASGKVSMNQAMIVLLCCLLFSVCLGYLVSHQLVMILLLYVVLNVIYSLWAKRVAYLDVIIIASGFMLRILAGTWGIGIGMSNWLLVCGTLLSLLLALSKRKLELNLLGGSAITRDALQGYNETTLNSLVVGSGSLCALSYFAYAINMGVYEHERCIVLTIPFCFFAVSRLIYLVFQKTVIDNPFFVLLNDRYSQINALCFIGISLLVLV